LALLRKPPAGRAACPRSPPNCPQTGLQKRFLTFVQFGPDGLPVAKRLKRVGRVAEFPGLSARSTTIVGIVVAVLIIGAVASIGYYQFEVAPFQTTSTTTSSTAASCTPSTCANVTIYTNAASIAPGFSPDSITIKVGTTVIWTNNDSSGTPHTVTPKNPSAGWETGSGTLSLGDTYEYTFTVAGTYAYICSIHPAVMSGTVIVQS